MLFIPQILIQDIYKAPTLCLKGLKVIITPQVDFSQTTTQILSKISERKPRKTKHVLAGER